MKNRLVLDGTWWIKQAAPGDLNEEGMLCESKLGENPSPDSGWYDSPQPYSVHEILLNHKALDDELLIGECESAKWVAETDWIYKTVFAGPVLSENGRVKLLFKGLDTIADVYLNGRHLSGHDDFYLPLSVEITDILEDTNYLTVYFHSPYKVMAEGGEKMPEEWKRYIPAYKLIRKPTQDFRAFSGPKPLFTPIGIYNDVVMEIDEGYCINFVDIDTELSEHYDKATISVKVDVEAISDAGTVVCVEVFGPEGDMVCKHEAPAGKNRSAMTLKINKPWLWWPKPYGGQPLYRIKTTLFNNGHVVDMDTRNIGIRRIRLVNDLLFEVNGVEIRLWGANYIPLFGLSHRWLPERAKTVLDLVNDSNMNVIRVWGSGSVPGDSFYDFADRNGVLIWQDFFAYGIGMFPDDDGYRQKCRAEAENLIRLLKHRPCILLWCGNNECYMIAKSEVGENRDFGLPVLFEDFPEICSRMDHNRYYHPSSPMGGKYPQDPMRGDMHGYLGVYYEAGIKYPHFFSESCRLVAPPLRSMKKFMKPRDIWPDDYTNTHYYRADFHGIEEYANRFRNNKDIDFGYLVHYYSIKYWRTLPIPPSWQRYISDFAQSELWNIENYYDADDLDSMLYKLSASGVEYLKRSIERVRRGRPAHDAFGMNRCVGYMIWKLNDTWPFINFTLIDYFLEPTATYYEVKRAFAPVLLSIDAEDDHIYLWGVNDSRKDITGKVVLKIFSRLQNETVKELEIPVILYAGEARVFTDLDRLGPIRRECILYGTLFDNDGNVLSSNMEYLDIERNNVFPDAKLDIKCDGDDLIITADKFARFVELTGDDDGDEFGWYFDDNYFDLLPFEEKRVAINGYHKKGTITAKAHYSKNLSRIEWNRV